MPELSVETFEVTGGTWQDKLDKDHPLIYADQIMSLAIGPYVSRLTYGVENHATFTRVPVATVVIPTTVLHAISAELVKQLGSDNFKNNAADQYKNYLGRDLPAK